MIASGNVVVDTAIGANTSIVKSCVEVRPSESVACTVNENCPTVVGVPENTPAALSDTPDGNEPVRRDHEYEPEPPTPVNDAEYAVPVMPTGSDAVNTDSGVSATAIDNVVSVVRPPESVTRTVNVDTELTVCEGVPERTPVTGFTTRPTGGVP